MTDYPLYRVEATGRLYQYDRDRGSWVEYHPEAVATGVDLPTEDELEELVDE